MSTTAKNDASGIEYRTNGATTFAGTDAVNCYSAFALAGYLDLYAKSGIVPTRGVNATKLLAMATSFTKKPYKRGEHAKAAADVREWARAMKAALPKTLDGNPVP